MRNKLYAGFVMALLLTLLFFAPIKRILVNTGHMTYENVGNEITGGGSGTAQAIALLEDTYTNYAPFYNSIVRLNAGLRQKLDEPITGYLITLAAQERKRGDVTGTDAETISAETISAETISAETEKTDSPAAEEQGVTIVSHTARYLNATDTHRNYLVTIEFSDGTTDSFLDRVVSLPVDVMEERLQNSIAHLQRICSYKTDAVHYYLYSGSRFQDAEFLSDYIPTEESSWGDLSRLFEALPDNVRYDWLKFKDGADRLQYIYRTDHHWTAAGADVGYREILDMMREDTPDIGAPLEGTAYSVDRIKFNGSFSRFANYYDIWDALSFTDYHLPPYTTEGSGTVFADAMAYYLSDEPQSISYEEFFPYFSKISYPENNTGRNLLILGDSFTRAISENLAYHFDNTYVIYPGAGADIGRYISRYGVTDVLILMYSDRLMYTIYNEIDWNRFLTRGHSGYNGGE